jgi:hypothetical protein
MTDLSHNDVPAEIPENAVFIIGAGHFGRRAARLLNQESNAPLFVVDMDRTSLSKLEDLPVIRIAYDGILFLVHHAHLLNASHTIVPAVPLHLAYQWLKAHLDGSFKIKKTGVPEEIRPLLPFAWPGNEGSLLVSYADFDCPDDCPEPEYCTVTGERRDNPLHDLLSHLELTDFKVLVIRSRQLAPGLGGYGVGELEKAAERISSEEKGKWLLGTSCKCHGILTALEIEKRTEVT